MSDINLLNLKPNKISRDLKGKFILIYGEAKSGKTSFSSLFPKPLLCAFERGYNALPGVVAVDIDKWSDFKKICAQLKHPEVKGMYETIVIDTVSIATDMCEKYVTMQNEVETLAEMKWGAGWSQYKKEFESAFRELTYLGYGIVFIAHSKSRATAFVDEEGEAIASVYPDITKTGMNIVNRLVDVIAYLAVEFDQYGNSARYLYTRQTPSVFAGSRYKYLKEKLLFGYQELVDSIADAIEEAVKIDGAETTDKTVIRPEKQRAFTEVQEESKQLWLKLTSDGNETNARIILDLIKKHLSKEAKLSELTEPQQEILELIIEDMKELK